MCKLNYARETKLWIKENSKFGRKWDKFQIKAQKSSQLISFWEICWPVRQTGRLVSYPGELVWHCMSVWQVTGDRLHWLLILRFLFFATLYNFSYQSGTCYSTSFPGFSPTLPRREPWEPGCRLLCSWAFQKLFPFADKYLSSTFLITPSIALICVPWSILQQLVFTIKSIKGKVWSLHIWQEKLKLKILYVSFS